MPKGLRSGCAAVFLATIAVTGFAGEAEDLRQCQKLKNAIERYAALRRGGGPAQQMEEWKRALRQAEARYRERGCRDLGAELD